MLRCRNGNGTARTRCGRGITGQKDENTKRQHGRPGQYARIR